MGPIGRILRFAALAIILLALGTLTFGGCAQFAVRADASVDVWYNLVGIRTHYVNADSVCISALSRSDTTGAAVVTVMAGPVCFDAYEYVRSFFPKDTTGDSIPDGADVPMPFEPSPIGSTSR